MLLWIYSFIEKYINHANVYNTLKMFEKHKKFAQIMIALRRSRVRRGILDYLSKIYPTCSYPAEIAEKIKTTPSNVLYALHGADGRYEVSNSLISLGLIEIEEVEGRRCYNLSEDGLEIAHQIG